MLYFAESNTCPYSWNFIQYGRNILYMNSMHMVHLSQITFKILNDTYLKPAILILLWGNGTFHLKIFVAGYNWYQINFLMELPAVHAKMFYLEIIAENLYKKAMIFSIWNNRISVLKACNWLKHNFEALWPLLYLFWRILPLIYTAWLFFFICSQLWSEVLIKMLVFEGPYTCTVFAVPILTRMLRDVLNLLETAERQGSSSALYTLIVHVVF